MLAARRGLARAAPHATAIEGTTVMRDATPYDPTAADIAVGDVVRLRKGHPCGDDRWRVVRIGAEVGLRCAGCGRKVELGRRVFGQRFKERLAGGGDDVAPGAARTGLDGP